MLNQNHTDLFCSLCALFETRDKESSDISSTGDVLQREKTGVLQPEKDCSFKVCTLWKIANTMQGSKEKLAQDIFKYLDYIEIFYSKAGLQALNTSSAAKPWIWHFDKFVSWWYPCSKMRLAPLITDFSWQIHHEHLTRES